MNIENYVVIKDYENYSISNLGNVKNTTSNKPITHNTTHKYIRVGLSKDKKEKKFYLHRLLAIAFIPNPDNCECVDHIDNNVRNNSLNNLRWATKNQNAHNVRISSRNTSGIKGVNWTKREKKWRARIFFDGKEICLGYFDSIEDAKTARQNKATELFGIFKNACEN